MRIPVIAVIRSAYRAQRPGDSGNDVAKDILGEGDKIQAVGGIGTADIHRGTRFGAQLGRKGFAVDYRASADPEISGCPVSFTLCWKIIVGIW